MIRTPMAIEWDMDVVTSEDPTTLGRLLLDKVRERTAAGYSVGMPMPLCGLTSYGLLCQKLVPRGPVENVPTETLMRKEVH